MFKMSQLHQGDLKRQDHASILQYVNNYVISLKLIMYSDQCGRQNKNINSIVTLCNYKVANPSIRVDEIDHKFLVSEQNL